jgi:two-component system chemotaxis response regulator CheY
MRVLVADDDPISRTMVAGIVVELGHECVVVNDGLQAWEAASVSGIDMLLTDWLMPGLDGPDLCRRVRAEANGQYSYIVLITGLRRPDQVLEGMNAGADDYLVKPIEPFALRTRLIAAQRVIDLHDKLRESQAKLETSNRELLELSLNDELTGLGNRRRMEEDLKHTHARAERSGRAYAITVFDVDHFKLYNDHYGHGAGDEALRSVAHSVTGASRTGERIYRQGGEELMALFPDCETVEAAATAATRMREAVAALRIPHAARPTDPDIVTVSCGVVQWAPGCGLTSAELLEVADAALYQAKSAGRNRVRIARAPALLELTFRV